MLSSRPYADVAAGEGGHREYGNCMRPIEKAEKMAPEGSWLTIDMKRRDVVGAPYGMPVQSWISTG